MGAQSGQAGLRSDFRAGTVWIYIAMFAVLGVTNWPRHPELSWINLAGVVIFLPLAVGYRVSRWRDAGRKEKVEE